MDNYISILINNQNHHFYGRIIKFICSNQKRRFKEISTQFYNQKIILQILYANKHTYYALPYTIDFYGYNNSGFSIYAKYFYNKINHDFWSMEFYYFPRDQFKLLIQIPNYVHTIKNLSSAKKIIPLLKQIPIDLHKTIYSYF